MQSKRESMFEAVMGVFIGFVVAMGTQIAIFPFFDIHITIIQNLKMCLIFTYLNRSWLLCPPMVQLTSS